MSDASRDLRQCAYGVGQSYPVTADVCRRAADYIEKLEQQLAELKTECDKLVDREGKKLSVWVVERLS